MATIIEKIIQNHSEQDVKAGKIVWMDLDVRTARDFAGANVVKNFRREYSGETVDDPAKTAFTFDCNVPANTIGYAENQQICRKFAREQGIKVYDVDAGIGSHVDIDKGLAVPGSTVVGTDSHLNILGAIGAFGQGMGDQDIAFAFKAGKTWFEVPETIKVILKGDYEYPTTAKDLTLYIVGKFGAKGALGKAVEFYGDVIDRLSLSERITLASMGTEMGAVISIIPPNEEVIKYCRQKSGSEDWQPVYADDDAEYAKVVEIDVSDLQPQIALPGHPDNVVPVKQVEGKRVDSIFLGSCTNGRYEDFKIVADILKGKKIANHVMFRTNPATREIYGKLLEDGILDILFQAGVIISNPGCGGCAAGQLGMTGEDEVQISTSNRNFTGKQGSGDTYLAAPAVAAASALKGEITDPNSVL
jgi:3-isopropylmalate/(R)-2-methylmalate dehydratase large subunit